MGISRTLVVVTIGIVIVAVAIGLVAWYTVMQRTEQIQPMQSRQSQKASGPVIVYSAIAEFETDRLLRAFSEQTGIEAKYVRLSAGELEARVKAEVAAGKVQADVILGGPMIYHEDLKRAGLLYKWDSLPENAKDIPSRYIDPDLYWFGFYVGAIGIAINTQALKKLNLSEPQGWEDLISSKYKGYIAVADPRTSGTAFTILATLLSLYGEDAGWDYAKRLWGNAGIIPKAGADPATLVGAGEFPIGIAFGHDILKVVQAGYPVKLIYPKEGTGWEIGGISILKNAPHLDVAKIFVNWMLGRQAGQLHTDISMRLSTRPDVVPPPSAPPLSSIKLLDNYRWMWASENMNDLLKKWETVVLGG